jgi:hypothetical protein
MSINSKDINIFAELLKCSEDFNYFASHYIKFNNSKKGLINFDMYQYQQNVIKSYEDHRFNIVIKFRSSGLTTLTVLYAYWLCAFKVDKKVCVFAKTRSEALHLSKIISLVVNFMPNWLKPNIKKSQDNCEIKFLATGSKIIFDKFEPACWSTQDLIVIDEVAFIESMEEDWKCIYPLLSMGGRAILLSTTNGVGNWFYNKWQDAISHKSTINPIHIDYREHPDYQKQEYVDMVRKNLGPASFMQEVEGQFVVLEDPEIQMKEKEYVGTLSNEELVTVLKSLAYQQTDISTKLKLLEAGIRLAKGF